MKKELNKWQIGLKISRDYRFREAGWRVFNFWLLKFIAFPDEGVMIRKENYKGIRILFRFWLPFESY